MTIVGGGIDVDRSIFILEQMACTHVIFFCT